MESRALRKRICSMNFNPYSSMTMSAPIGMPWGSTPLPVMMSQAGPYGSVMIPAPLGACVRTKKVCVMEQPGSQATGVCVCVIVFVCTLPRCAHSKWAGGVKRTKGWPSGLNEMPYPAPPYGNDTRFQPSQRHGVCALGEHGVCALFRAERLFQRNSRRVQ